MKNIKEEFQNLDEIKIFEVEVLDNRTKENDWIIFDIEIVKSSFFVSFVPLTKKQEKSKKIAHFKQKIDKFYSLDKHLEDLYSECINQIILSDFYELID